MDSESCTDTDTDEELRPHSPCSPPPPPEHFANLKFVAWMDGRSPSVVADVPMVPNEETGDWCADGFGVVLCPTHQTIRLHWYCLGVHEASFRWTNTDVCLASSAAPPSTLDAEDERPYTVSMALRYTGDAFLVSDLVVRSRGNL